MRAAGWHPSGRSLSAWVDGQLAPSAADRVRAHVSSCPRCRALVQEDRAARRALSSVDDVAPSPDLVDRLVSVARSPEATTDERAGLRARRRHPWRIPAVIATGAASAVVVGLLVADQSPGPVDLVAAGLAPPVVTPVAEVEPAADDGDGVDLGDAALAHDPTAAALEWMRSHDWVVPAFVPTGLDVVAAGLAEDGTLVVELLGAQSVVRLTERRGVLADGALAEAVPVQVGTVHASLVSSDPWTVVTQVGDTVVVVACHGSAEPGRALLAALVVDEDDGGRTMAP